MYGTGRSNGYRIPKRIRRTLLIVRLCTIVGSVLLVGYASIFEGANWAGTFDVIRGIFTLMIGMSTFVWQYEWVKLHERERD